MATRESVLARMQQLKQKKAAAAAEPGASAPAAAAPAAAAPAASRSIVTRSTSDVPPALSDKPPKRRQGSLPHDKSAMFGVLPTAGGGDGGAAAGATAVPPAPAAVPMQFRRPSINAGEPPPGFVPSARSPEELEKDKKFSSNLIMGLVKRATAVTAATASAATPASRRVNPASGLEEEEAQDGDAPPDELVWTGTGTAVSSSCSDGGWSSSSSSSNSAASARSGRSGAEPPPPPPRVLSPREEEFLKDAAEVRRAAFLSAPPCHAPCTRRSRVGLDQGVLCGCVPGPSLPAGICAPRQSCAIFYLTLDSPKFPHWCTLEHFSSLSFSLAATSVETLHI